MFPPWASPHPEIQALSGARRSQSSKSFRQIRQVFIGFSNSQNRQSSKTSPKKASLRLLLIACRKFLFNASLLVVSTLPLGSASQIWWKWKVRACVKRVWARGQFTLLWHSPESLWVENWTAMINQRMAWGTLFSNRPWQTQMLSQVLRSAQFTCNMCVGFSLGNSDRQEC